MPVTEHHMKPSDDIHKRVVTLGPTDVGNSQADVEFDEFAPGYAFEVVRAEVYAIAATASADADVKIGGTSCLAAVVADPSAKTRVVPTLATALASRRGSASDAITLHATTDGGGDFTGLRARVTYRKFPLGGGDNPTVT